MNLSILLFVSFLSRIALKDWKKSLYFFTREPSFLVFKAHRTLMTPRGNDDSVAKKILPLSSRLVYTHPRKQTRISQQLKTNFKKKKNE